MLTTNTRPILKIQCQYIIAQYRANRKILYGQFRLIIKIIKLPRSSLKYFSRVKRVRVDYTLCTVPSVKVYATREWSCDYVSLYHASTWGIRRRTWTTFWWYLRPTDASLSCVCVCVCALSKSTTGRLSAAYIRKKKKKKEKMLPRKRRRITWIIQGSVVYPSSGETWRIQDLIFQDLVTFCRDAKVKIQLTVAQNRRYIFSFFFFFPRVFFPSARVAFSSLHPRDGKMNGIFT